MKIELSNGVIVLTPPEISAKIQAILFPESEPESPADIPPTLPKYTGKRRGRKPKAEQVPYEPKDDGKNDGFRAL